MRLMAPGFPAVFPAAAVMIALASAAACAGGPDPVEVIRSVRVADARDALTAAGATVDKVTVGPDTFEVAAAISPERHVWFNGLDCTGKAEAMACPEFKIYAGWAIDTPAHAAALASQLNYNYTSVHADGTDLELWRMDFIPGGVTREHFGLAVKEFLDLRAQAEAIIYPPAGKDAPRGGERGHRPAEVNSAPPP